MLLLDSGGERTPPYHAAGDHHHHQASCASRPNPEGSLSAWELREQEEDRQREGHEEEQWEELQRLCRRCHIVMCQLKRQAAALTDRSSLQVRNQVSGVQADGNMVTVTMATLTHVSVKLFYLKLGEKV